MGTPNNCFVIYDPETGQWTVHEIAYPPYEPSPFPGTTETFPSPTLGPQIGRVEVNTKGYIAGKNFRGFILYDDLGDGVHCVNANSVIEAASAIAALRYARP